MSRAEQTGGAALLRPRSAWATDPASTGTIDADTGAPLERAVRLRLGVFRATGSRFALVVLRVLRFEEAASYYGEESSQRIIAAVSRRGTAPAGTRRAALPAPRRKGGLPVRDRRRPDGRRHGGSATEWADPTDIESLAMALGRKACEHLVDGHRVECVVGWASAPSDGLNADDLCTSPRPAPRAPPRSAGGGGQVTVPERARVAAG